MTERTLHEETIPQKTTRINNRNKQRNNKEKEKFYGNKRLAL